MKTILSLIGTLAISAALTGCASTGSTAGVDVRPAGECTKDCSGDCGGCGTDKCCGQCEGAKLSPASATSTSECGSSCGEKASCDAAKLTPASATSECGSSCGDKKACDGAVPATLINASSSECGSSCGDKKACDSADASVIKASSTEKSECGGCTKG